jgi:hypothetical protein
LYFIRASEIGVPQSRVVAMRFLEHPSEFFNILHCGRRIERALARGWGSR